MIVSHSFNPLADELVWKEDMKDDVEEDDEWEECSVESEEEDEDEEDAPELVSLAQATSKKGKAPKAAVNVRHSGNSKCVFPGHVVTQVLIIAPLTLQLPRCNSRHPRIANGRTSVPVTMIRLTVMTKKKMMKTKKVLRTKDLSDVMQTGNIELLHSDSALSNLACTNCSCTPLL